MGFEFGIAKNKYDAQSDHDIYFFWCGWENTDLYRLFTQLSDEKYPFDYDGEYKVAVDKFSFIDTIYHQVIKNDDYNIINKLFLFDDEEFIYRYFEELSAKEKAMLRLAFLPDTNDYVIKQICIEIYKRFEDGYGNMLEALYNAYQDMKKDNVNYVWIYGG